MKGSYKIKVKTKKLVYELKINRNITIIQGDSATGKTTLINYIEQYSTDGKESGVHLECDKNCVVLSGKDWEHRLSAIHDSIVFIDEYNKFKSSNEFANAIKNSDNYYVIVTRDDLHSLPYSVNEIYGFKTSGKLKSTEPIYNEMYRIYYVNQTYTTIRPDMIITEDSNSGYDFFNKISKSFNKKCISAEGRDKIANLIKPNNYINLIIADGAAFGPSMRKVIELIKLNNNYYLYLPESFEWIILKANLFRLKYMEEILSNPSEYIDSKEYFSWERYFTALLSEVTRNDDRVANYNKSSKLGKFYTNTVNIEKILSLMDNIKF